MFGCSVKEKVRKFYKAANAIFRIDGHSDNGIMLRLIETHCVPILSYGCEILHVADRDEKRSLRVAYNSVFRKIYGYKWSESVTNKQHELGRFTWEELIEDRQSKFIDRLTLCTQDSLVRAFANV